MKNTVTKRQIDELLEKSEIKVETVYDKVTIVTCKLPNGFVITESSGAVSPANYDKKIGTEEAGRNARYEFFEKIFMIVRKKGIWRRTYIKNR